MNSWLILSGAIISEVIATTALRLGSRATDDPSKYAWYAAVVVGYGISFALLSLVLKKIEMGVTYAVWSGVGTALIAGIGIALFGESATAIKFAFLFLIVIGVVGLNLSGTHQQ
jgi:small multidrug resistance pump